MELLHSVVGSANYELNVDANLGLNRLPGSQLTAHAAF